MKWLNSICQRGDSNPHGLLHWILSPAPRPSKIGSTRPARTDEDRKRPASPVGATIPATRRFPGDTWCWE